MEHDWDNGGWEINFREWDGEECVYTVLQNIGNVHRALIVWKFDTRDILVPLDGPNGDPIDLDIVFPYFPDYTFKGLFPGMNSHADWQALYNLLI